MSANPAIPTGLAAAPHRKRPLRFIRRLDIAGWRMKLYGIALPGRSPRPALLEASIATAARVLPQPPVAAEHYGVGFVIAHDADNVSIGLTYWWQSQNELHQRVHVGAGDEPGTLHPVEHPAAGCVWELGIIDFERRMWLEDVLANPTGPDLDRYLDRRIDIDL